MEGFAKPPCGVLKAGRAADGSAAEPVNKGKGIMNRIYEELKLSIHFIEDKDVVTASSTITGGTSTSGEGTQHDPFNF